ncbi:hypothetical protein HK101_004826 [Irineochytrium annulatum]|nr:hypothetical protein HK101_004826 [Irineochytrium annulatum]
MDYNQMYPPMMPYGQQMLDDGSEFARIDGQHPQYNTDAAEFVPSGVGIEQLMTQQTQQRAPWGIVNGNRQLPSPPAEEMERGSAFGGRVSPSGSSNGYATAVAERSGNKNGANAGHQRRVSVTSKRDSKGPVLWDFVQGGVSGASSAGKKKSAGAAPPKCLYGARCKNGSCTYSHGVENCKFWPNCRFGDKCKYAHPAVSPSSPEAPTATA